MKSKNLWIGIIVGVIIGIGIEYLLCTDKIFSGKKLGFGTITDVSKKVPFTGRILFSDAVRNINAFEVMRRDHPGNLPNVLLAKSWLISAEAFNAILAQKDDNQIKCEFIRFYPALNTAGDSVTFVMVGQVGDELLLKRKGTDVEGEIWDYIGPCPPPTNCPKTDLKDVK